MKSINKRNKSLCKLIKHTFFSMFILVIGYTAVKSSQSISKGILIGMKYCIEILIPSLFPLMFLSKFIVISNLLNFLKKPMNKITELLFYLPGCCLPTIILSLIGGYPIGAVGIRTLFDKKEINSEQLNRMMCFCINAGPGFILNVVGFSLLKKPFLGIIILLSQILISILIGIACGIYARIKNETLYYKNSEEKEMPLSETFIDTTSQISHTLINMCTLIIAFNSLISIIREWQVVDLTGKIGVYLKVNPYNLIFLLISGLEITSGCSLILNKTIPLSLIASAIGHGGICTHFQILDILKNTKFNYYKFFVFRLINSFISFVITEIILKTTKITLPTFFSTINSSTPSMSTTIYGSIGILILCIYFTLNLYSYNQENINAKKF